MIDFGYWCLSGQFIMLIIPESPFIMSQPLVICFSDVFDQWVTYRQIRSMDHSIVIGQVFRSLGVILANPALTKIQMAIAHLPKDLL